MSSILTNTSAMVALQTLKTINSNLNKVQNEISTGKTVAVARDNAAVWAISKVLESDAKGFKGISDSLALGSSTLTVAREAAEKVQSLLTDMKSKIVTAQGENVPREKLQTDINALRDQISSIVGAAQFSGMNLISGQDDVKFLSSLDRSGTGVAVSDITVQRQDLSVDDGVWGSGATLATNITIEGSATAVASAANTARITFTGNWNADAATMATLTVGGRAITYSNPAVAGVNAAAAHFSSAINALGVEGLSASVVSGVLTISSQNPFDTVAVALTGVAGGTAVIDQINGAGIVLPNTASSSTIPQRAEQINFSTTANVNDGDGYRVQINGVNYSYIAGKGETMEDVARGLKIAIDSAQPVGITTQVSKSATGQWRLSVDNDGTGSTSQSLAVFGIAGGEATGGLAGLNKIDVTTTTGARDALANIETMINTAIDAAAEFGSAQNRIDIQTSFVKALTDAMTAGIGTLVDADMEEASARLQALQVQQQLGIQALSIANQAPQNLLALFR